MNREYIFSFLKTTSDVKKVVFWNELKKLTRKKLPCDVMIHATDADLRAAFSLIQRTPGQ